MGLGFFPLVVRAAADQYAASTRQPSPKGCDTASHGAPGSEPGEVAGSNPAPSVDRAGSSGRAPLLANSCPPEAVYALSALMERDLDTFVPPVEEIFAPGLYCRKMVIPAGVLITGMLYREAHFATCLSGSIRVHTSVDGVERGVETREAGYIGLSPAGTQRVGFTYEETVWATFHPNPDNETDSAALLARICEPVPDLGSIDLAGVPRLELA